MFRKSKKAVDLLKAVPAMGSGNSGRARHIVRRTVLAVVLTLVAIGLISIPFFLAGSNAYRLALSGKGSLEAAEQSIMAFDLVSAESQALEAAEAFESSRLEVGKFGFLIPFPWFGERLAAIDRLLVAGQASAEAIHQAVGVGRQILSAVGEGGLPITAQLLPESGISGMSAEDKRNILIALAESGPKLRETSERISRAIAAFDNLPDDELVRPYRDRLASARSKLEIAGYAIDAVLPAVESLPKALGYPKAQRYLFFLQNSTEMRPTGGFLGLVGQMTVKDAEFESLEMHDTYAYDGPSVSVIRPPAPDPIRKYAKVEQWYLRDANWSPDFTISAPLMEQFFLEEAAVKDGIRPEPFDGVIAVTPDLAEDILRLTGPVTVGEHTFNADNLVDELEFQVEMAFEEQGISRDDRKLIVGELMSEMIDRVSGFDLIRLQGLMTAVRSNLEEGHILLYSSDSQLQALILEHDWGGKMRQTDGDYVSVIDANIAALKSDPAVDRRIKYSIRPDSSGSYEGCVAITYTNNGSFTWKTTRYRTYTRLYVPKGSRLLGVNGALENDKLNDPAGTPGKADVGEEAGRQWFGAFISIEPGQSRTLEFRFTLSESVLNMLNSGEYRLTAEKQPGTPGYGLTLDLDFGKNLTAAEPSENPEKFGDSLYQVETDLRIDRDFRVLMKD